LSTDGFRPTRSSTRYRIFMVPVGLSPNPEVIRRWTNAGALHVINTRMRHARDLTDKQWKVLDPLIPEPIVVIPLPVKIQYLPKYGVPPRSSFLECPAVVWAVEGPHCGPERRPSACLRDQRVANGCWQEQASDHGEDASAKTERPTRKRTRNLSRCIEPERHHELRRLHEVECASRCT
jgi:hypothetical protein